MNRLIGPTLLLALLLSACGGGNNEDAGTAVAINKQAVFGVILPGYERFALNAAQLQQDVDDYCGVAEGNIAVSQATWLAAMSAWQSIQLVNFGPADEELRLRIQFYPDERGLVAEQLEAMLADEQPISEARIASATAPVQGLPAMEYLLFSAVSLERLAVAENRSRSCAALGAITAHLASRAAGLSTAWQAAAATQASKDIDGVADLAGAVVAQVVILRDDKLGVPLGIRNGNLPQAEACESALSRSSISNLYNGLSGMERLFTGLGDRPGLDDALISAGVIDYLKAILRAITESQHALEGLSLPLCEGIADEAGREQLFALFDGSLRDLRDLMQQLPAQLAISTGFNANDGD